MLLIMELYPKYIIKIKTQFQKYICYSQLRNVKSIHRTVSLNVLMINFASHISLQNEAPSTSLDDLLRRYLNFLII